MTEPDPIIRTRKDLPKRAPKRSRREAKPYYSTSPWTGFTSREVKRMKPLAFCPSKRCLRARACIDAHDDLYCQRTHRRPPKRKRAPVDHKDGGDVSAMAERLKLFAEDQQARHDALRERWKAGEFDALYGRYSPRGVLMAPPPKIYVGPAWLSKPCEKDANRSER